ncbi:MAG: hypothetical protein CUN55_02270 [Phototrophicales bacterium]|nr:MAG: hypothetical protein CUN55_02270 [Phototrophicales bacterium]
MKHKILLEDRQIHYTVRIHPRAKHIRIKVNPIDGVIITMPVDTKREASDVLREHAAWVLKQLDRWAGKVTYRKYVSGETLPFLGVAHTLQIIQKANERISTVKRQDETLIIRLANTIKEETQREHIRKTLERWYRKQARSYLTQRTEFWANEIGVTYQRIRIKGQRTRWGSCSARGGINYNWRIMMAPPQAVDYLIVHELCHLIVMNHSPVFWGIVSVYCPAYLHWRHWLKENAFYLQL